MESLITYFIKITPAFILGIGLLGLLPKHLLPVRIFIYIFFFILARDAMTPLGLWKIDSKDFFWLRLSNDSLILISLAILCTGLVFTINYFEPELRALLVYNKTSMPISFISGIIGGVIVFLPCLIFYSFIPIANRGGDVQTSILLPLFLMCILGNFYEEILFRGYFQGYIETFLSPVKSAISSGLLFSFGHIFLATTVTNLGLPVLLFTLYEGLIAAFMRMKFGLVSATITHGLGIFLIASGLY